MLGIVRDEDDSQTGYKRRSQFEQKDFCLSGFDVYLLVYSHSVQAIIHDVHPAVF